LETQLANTKSDCVEKEKSAVAINLRLESMSLEKMNKEAEFRLTEQKNQKDIVNLTSNLSLSESGLADLKAANKALEEIFEKQNTRNTELSDELAIEHETRDKLEERVSVLDGQVLALTGDVDSFSTTIQSLKEENAGMRTSCDSRDAELRTVGEELAEMSIALVEEKRVALWKLGFGDRVASVFCDSTAREDTRV
jgi:chromosome segregation ATPase